MGEIVEIGRLVVDEEMAGEGVANAEFGVYCVYDAERTVPEMLDETAAVGQPALLVHGGRRHENQTRILRKKYRHITLVSSFFITSVQNLSNNAKLSNKNKPN